jgi:hypothetical protein
MEHLSENGVGEPMPILKKAAPFLSAPLPDTDCGDAAPPAASEAASGATSGKATSAAASLPPPRPSVPETSGNVCTAPETISPDAVSPDIVAPDAAAAAASAALWQSILPTRPSLLDLIHFEEPASDSASMPRPAKEETNNRQSRV